MGVLGSQANSDFVFVVNLVDIWIDCRQVEHSMAAVESHILYQHTEEDLAD